MYYGGFPGEYFAEVASSGIKRLYFQWILEKLVVSIEIKFSSMVAGLQNNSATWPLRFRIKSLAMDKWYLVSLVAHLNWPGFLENFFAFSNNLKWNHVLPLVNEYLEK